jgi:hypothetical protein
MGIIGMGRNGCRASIAAFALAAVALPECAAHANGIAGDRVFPSTLTIDDTQNDDELSLPTIALLRRGANGDVPGGRDLAVAGEYARLLTPDLALTTAAGWHRRGLDGGALHGWDNLEIGLKYRTFLSESDELLVSTALNIEIGGSGAARIGAERSDAIEPGLTFGKGFGALPHGIDWLRPLAIAGAGGFSLPTGSAPKTVRYGLSLQYSLYYADRHVGSIAVPGWAAELIPLVEFAAETPFGRNYGSATTMTLSPGIAWVGDTMQLTGEVLLPLNRRAGSGVGVIAQIHLFLDELAPSVFGKPLFAAD